MTGRAWRPGDPVDWDRPGELWTAGGLHAFVVETTGAKTGALRRAVLGYLEDGPDAWLVIGSKGGAPTNPAWVHNIAANASATKFIKLHPFLVCETPAKSIGVYARIGSRLRS